MDIIVAHATKNPCYKKGQKMIPQGIVVHSTGAENPNLKRYVDAPDAVGVNSYGNHWNNENRNVCVHAFIGYDKDKNVRVAEILPLDICAWGVGNGRLGSYNYDPAYIQFEICEDSLSDEVYYKKAFDAAAEYCAHLCREYSISIENIVGHNEAHKLGYASNHGDPEHWMQKFGETMNDFRQKVSETLEKEEKQKVIYCVQIGAFAEQVDAESAIKKIQEIGYNGVVIPLEVVSHTVKEEPRTEPTMSQTKSVDEIAKEVIKGKWGNGDERKKRLTEAGYDPSEVQARVNELL